MQLLSVSKLFRSNKKKVDVYFLSAPSFVLSLVLCYSMHYCLHDTIELKHFKNLLNSKSKVYVPFIKSLWSLLRSHGSGTVDDACICVGRCIHEAGFHHIHRRGQQCGAEPRPKPAHNMTQNVVTTNLVLQYKFFDHVVSHKLRYIDDRVASYVRYCA